MNSTEIIETAKFVKQGYQSLGSMPLWQLVSMLDRLENNVIIVRDEDGIAGVALYAMVNKLTLERLWAGILRVNKEKDMSLIFESQGSNLHILAVVAKDTKTILEGLHKLIAKHHPQTVSWIKPNGEFRMVRGGI